MSQLPPTRRPPQIRNEDLRPEHLPPSVGPPEMIQWFALSYDGCDHFGGDVGALRERANAIRRTYKEEGVLPDDLGELRACLYIEQRRYRFTWIDVELERIAEGRYAIREDPNGPVHREQEAYERALVARIRELISRR